MKGQVVMGWVKGIHKVMMYIRNHKFYQCVARRKSNSTFVWFQYSIELA